MIAWQEFLSANPKICGGEICAIGTRIPVTVILDSLAEGSTADEIQASYPSLSPHHIGAALAFGAELAHEERLVPIRLVKIKLDENLPLELAHDIQMLGHEAETVDVEG
ncbi:MAG TPA: DUF433 domain-containing protein [Bryobacteraceae bacterium]|jgi:uncharacterized protein (DUF433 family)